MQESSPSDSPKISVWDRLKNWALLRGHRRHIAVGQLVFIYAVLLVAGQLWPLQMQELLTEQRTVQTLMNTLLGGVILLVSIVVSINSLVVSEELAPIGAQYDRVTGSWEFRTESADIVDKSVTPSRPTEFLLTILASIDDDTDELALALEREQIAVDGDLESCLAAIDDYVDRTGALLTDSRFDSADMRLFGPEYDPVGELDAARQLDRELDMSDDSAEALDDIVEGLEFFTSAREYFKTMYYKREFARLSRDLIYAGVPAVILLSYLILALTGDVLPGSTFGFSHLYLFFSLSFVISLLPFFLLASYVIRAAVIAEDTITAGGFILE